MSGATTPRVIEELLTEILRDSHRYAPGIEPHRATLNSASPPSLRRGLVRAAHRGRNLAEQAVARTGFTRRHHDPAQAAAALGRILELGEGIEQTADRLGDDASRRALLDVLKLRVLGPYHAPLRFTPDHFRSMQSHVERTMMREPATFEVSDPWFSQVSRFEVSMPDGPPIALHAHSVDVVSVFLLDQYSYRHDGHDVAAQPGDVVLDAGGCWGDTALYFANLVGPAGKVYTFEFDPENLEIMRANLALNPDLAGRIELVEKALWDSSGETLEFALGGRTTTLFPSDPEAPLTVETITLDDFVEAAGPARVDFVKMDVEGAEARVLAGARATLARCTPKLALAAYHRDDDLVALPRVIEAVDPRYRYCVHTCSAVEEETVLFAEVSG